MVALDNVSIFRNICCHTTSEGYKHFQDPNHSSDYLGELKDVNTMEEMLNFLSLTVHSICQFMNTDESLYLKNLKYIFEFGKDFEQYKLENEEQIKKMQENVQLIVEQNIMIASEHEKTREEIHEEMREVKEGIQELVNYQRSKLFKRRISVLHT